MVKYDVPDPSLVPGLKTYYFTYKILLRVSSSDHIYFQFGRAGMKIATYILKQKGKLDQPTVNRL